MNIDASFGIQAVILITGIVGNFYVARKEASGFVWWIVGNLALIAVSVRNELWLMVLLYAYYTGTAVYALCTWDNRITALFRNRRKIPTQSHWLFRVVR